MLLQGGYHCCGNASPARRHDWDVDIRPPRAVGCGGLTGEQIVEVYEAPASDTDEDFTRIIRGNPDQTVDFILACDRRMT
jgi:hypothetical protein